MIDWNDDNVVTLNKEEEEAYSINGMSSADFREHIFGTKMFQKTGKVVAAQTIRNYIDFCSGCKIGTIVRNERNSCFVKEITAPLYFEYNLPKLKKNTTTLTVEPSVIKSMENKSKIWKTDGICNLGIVSMFIQRGTYTGIIYQPNINHRQLNIRNYTKVDDDHTIPLTRSALRYKNLTITNQNHAIYGQKDNISLKATPIWLTIIFGH